MAGSVPHLFLRLSSKRSPLPPIRILSPSSSRRHPLDHPSSPVVDIASIESDVEGALSGSSGEDRNILLCPLSLSSSLLFSSGGEKLPERDDTDKWQSVERRYQTKFRNRAIFLSSRVDSKNFRHKFLENSSLSIFDVTNSGKKRTSRLKDTRPSKKIWNLVSEFIYRI